jgi:hypothetical protein
MHDTTTADSTGCQLEGASRSAEAKRSGNSLLAMGLTVGVVGAAGAALGVVCPVCVVVTPALLGAAAVQRLRAVLLSRLAPSPISEVPAEARTPPLRGHS